MILHEGQPLLDKAQSSQDAQLTERLLEQEAALGPDWAQVRQHGWVLPLGCWHVLCLAVNN